MRPHDLRSAVVVDRHVRIEAIRRRENGLPTVRLSARALPAVTPAATTSTASTVNRRAANVGYEPTIR